MNWRSNWFVCKIRALLYSCKICRGNANRSSPWSSVVRPRSTQGTVCAPTDWRHSVSTLPPARLSTWTNCITLIGWRYTFKANTPWSCCKWLVMTGTIALSILTSCIELFNSYCLWSQSYFLPRRLHSFLLIGYLFISLLLLYTPWLFHSFPSSPIVLFAFLLVFFFSFIFSSFQSSSCYAISYLWHFRFTGFVSIQWFCVYSVVLCLFSGFVSIQWFYVYSVVLCLFPK
jgi:hypothetical protein